eukprot:TRINITY_DN31463_c0_g1_i1.p1 TRINITY_DN31463_c0_g1~~TRINITY_DN31463_c0_g1_i1.p1  ORF type:complete len:531 (-),score=75.66 TRINITY_DN31463_c0_g1_i1:204-1796(-)
MRAPMAPVAPRCVAFLVFVNAVATSADKTCGNDGQCADVAEAEELEALHHSLLQRQLSTVDDQLRPQEATKGPNDPKCTEWPSTNGKYSFKERCEYGNRFSDGYEYIYNENRGKDSAACGRDAACWCCRRPRALNPEGEWRGISNQVVDDEGTNLGEVVPKAAGDCERACDENNKCNSFTYCGNKCYLFDKKLNGGEPRHHNDYCTSKFKTTATYLPSNPELARPSNGDAVTFHLYRATSASDFNEDGKLKYPLGNNNLGSIGSIMWYLHHEVIFTCNGEGFLSDSSEYEWGDRKFAIDTIQRIKVTMKATTPLQKKGMNYGVLKSFDKGEATGPHRNPPDAGVGTGMNSLPEWEEFGYHVGCAKGGDFPHKDWIDRGARLYPNWIWYSFPSACPVKNRYDADDVCKRNHPGGFCDNPTGQGNCTWTYEEDGLINIDELVGMTKAGGGRWNNRAEFCSECGLEGRWKQPSGCPDKFNFWGENIFWDQGNRQRTEAALNMFKKKYPGTEHMEPPPCDFNAARYGIDLATRL